MFVYCAEIYIRQKILNKRLIKTTTKQLRQFTYHNVEERQFLFDPPEKKTVVNVHTQNILNTDIVRVNCGDYVLLCMADVFIKVRIQDVQLKWFIKTSPSHGSVQSSLGGEGVLIILPLRLLRVSV